MASSSNKKLFELIRKWAWLFLVLVAIGGIWFPKLGLLMIPVMLTLVVMGFLKGKYWCGHFCPHASLFDFIIKPISFNNKIPPLFKSNIAKGIMFIWFMVMFSSRLTKVFQIFGTVSFIDKLGYVFVMNYLMVTIIGTLLAVFISPRTWCSICPMGTMQVLMYRLGKKLKINKTTDSRITCINTEKCIQCGKCARVCPMQLEPFKELNDNNQLDNDACIRCNNCVKSCPVGILTLQNEKDSIDVQYVID